ncbi:MAG TPA: hypothetical protein VNY31_07715 [Solirubrobacteraceae bacterium]|jgi:hypothetical protein|nr:hypothetical protein [Solirubrobacteraceae bacterium]
MDGIRGESRLKFAAGIVLISAWPALWIGIHDVLSPLSFSSQALGLAFTVAGLCIAAGMLALAFSRPPTIGPGVGDAAAANVREEHLARLIFFASAASTIVALSIAISAIGYRPEWIAMFFFVAVVSALVTVKVGLHDHFGAVTGALKSSLLAGGTIIAFASFAYQNIYVPGNTEVGIEFSASASYPQIVSRDIALIPVRVTTRDTSSVGAAALSSVVTITGISYSGRGRKRLGEKAAQKREIGMAEQAGSTEPGAHGLDDVFPGREHRTVLAVLRPFRDGSLIFPGATYSDGLVVAVPRQAYHELEVRQELSYASSDRLTLQSRDAYRHSEVTRDNCGSVFRQEWHLRESALRAFSRGQQIVVTEFCADRGHEEVKAYVRNEGQTSESTVDRNNRLYGLHFTSHEEHLLLR